MRATAGRRLLLATYGVQEKGAVVKKSSASPKDSAAMAGLDFSRASLLSLLLFLQLILLAEAAKVAIIGSGVAGSSAAYFLKREDPSHEVHVFEQHEYVGGRVKDVFLSGDRFEAGAAIIHRANKHMMHFAQVGGALSRGLAAQRAAFETLARSFVLEATFTNCICLLEGQECHIPKLLTFATHAFELAPC